MDGFNSLPKMACFKEGGHVSKEKLCSGGAPKKCSGGRMKEGGKADLAQDKALIKKAISQHDKQEHPGEKTKLTLKNGGRSKKAKGTVKKYKAGGLIEAKEEKKEAKAPSKAVSKPKETLGKDSKGSGAKKVKKADGGVIGTLKNALGLGNKKDNSKKAAVATPAPTPVPPPKRQIQGLYAPSAELAKFNDNYADGGAVNFGQGGMPAQSPIPPSIAAQLMQAQQNSPMVGNMPNPMGNPTIPGDNPVISGGY